MLRQATRVASLSTCRFKHGAVITKGGSVIAVGVNSDRNHPCIVSNPKTEASIHAEAAVIKACAGVDLRGATIYVARVYKNGQQAMSKPCIYREQLIKLAGIKRVVWAIENSKDL